MSRQAVPPPHGGRPAPSAPPPASAWEKWVWPIALAFIALMSVLVAVTGGTSQAENLSYSRFLTDIDAHQIRTVTIDTDGAAHGTLADGHEFSTTIPSQAGQPLLDRLAAAQVEVSATASGPSGSSQLVSWLLLLAPIVLLGWWWRRLSGGTSAAVQGTMGIGKSRAKVFDTERPTTTFADVAGYEGPKAEIVEVVDFLRNPERYRRAGATAPRGVLMVGPPGTGKTLLARAVAGEAQVPFFSVTGSSFVEMFVGVGAARVRDLFAEARKRAPAIVFVDEVDAIGGRRTGAGAMVSNDEREQTLNQLLAEMDGFDPTSGIVVLAATNRPDVLDAALLRPGRFDRQVVIPLPTQAERAAILAVHCRHKRLGPDVELGVIARATPGFSGADLANLANEAAIGAARENREVLDAEDFEIARDRILLGRREGSNVLLPEEKRVTAVHEAGHALVAALSPHADPVAKVTILPAGQTLGVTEQLPVVERHMFGEDYLADTLTIRLAGRAAELVVLGQGSTGAANDLAQATELAIKMVREFGLSSTVGPVGYPHAGSTYLGTGGTELTSRPFAEATQAKIDSEVSRLLRAAEQRALDLLTTHRTLLEQLAELLLEHETVDGAVVYQLAGTVDAAAERGGAGATTVAPHRARTTERRAVNGQTVRRPTVARAPAATHPSSPSMRR